MYTKDQVASQMEALLSSADEVTRNQAHEYLMKFQNSQEAWSVCRELLVPQTQHASLFLASQILYKKIQDEWHLLEVSQKQELRNYLLTLVGSPLNNPQAFKKICQALAMVGVLSITTFWENFIVDVLNLQLIEPILEVVDCIPHCVEEHCISKKVSEFIKTKIREAAPALLDFFCYAITDKGYLPQVVEVLKNWRGVTLPILGHNQLFTCLANSFAQKPYFLASLCETFVNAISSTEYSKLLLTRSYKGDISQFLCKIPQPDLKNLETLIQTTIQLAPETLYSEDEVLRRRFAELSTCIISNYMIFLFDTRFSDSLWELLTRVSSHQDLSICMTAIEVYYDLKEGFTRNVESLEGVQVFDKLKTCVETIATRCRYDSEEHYIQLTQSQSDEEIPFQDFRISAEDVFYSIYIIYEKHNPNGGRAFLSNLSPLIQSPTSSGNSELFVFICRAVLMAITENSEYLVLSDIVKTALGLPSSPIVVKTVIYLVNDIGLEFKNIPELFPSAVEYVVGSLVNNVGSGFMIDSNAVECLLNFSCECGSLFTYEIVMPLLQTCETVLPGLKNAIADKLVEALLNVVIKLPDDSRNQSVKKVCSYLDYETRNLVLDQNSQQKFSKCIIMWASALNSLSEIPSRVLVETLGEAVPKAIEVACVGMSLYKDTEGIVTAVSLFMKRVLKAFNVECDLYFGDIANCMLSNYTKGNEEALSVVVQGISTLGNCPNTLNWISANFASIYRKLFQEIQLSPEPDLISNFFDLQHKFYECVGGLSEEVISENLYLGCKLLPLLSTRNSSKSVITFFNLVFGQENQPDSLKVYCSEVVKQSLANLHIINRNSIQFLAYLFGDIRSNYQSEFYNGLVSGFQAFENFSQNERERLIYCFVNVETSPVFQMKNLLQTLSNILKGMGNFDSIVATEIAIASKQRTKVNL